MKTLKEVWKYSTIPQRQKLIRAVGGHKSFAILDDVDDLPKRSGGLLYFDLKKLEKRWQQKK